MIFTKDCGKDENLGNEVLAEIKNGISRIVTRYAEGKLIELEHFGITVISTGVVFCFCVVEFGICEEVIAVRALLTDVFIVMRVV